MQEQSHKPIVRYLFLSIFLFLIGFVPRVLALSAFLTPDEFRWVSRSRDFLTGLLTGNWAATLQSGFPGVTTMWTGSLGLLYSYWARPSSAPDSLLDFVRHVSEYHLPMEYVAPVRFPTVILTSATIVAVFWLAARLLDRRSALLAAGLLALDPFHLALSRVLHNDALVTTFMALSVLPMIGYWLHGWRRRWLWISGVMAGLAFVSKSSALLLMPFCAIAGVGTYALRWRQGEQINRHAIARLILDGLGWGAIAWLIYVVVWPAMWVEPDLVLGTTFGVTGRYLMEGHELGNYFMGQFTSDPGPLFYPLSWLLRTTPVVLLGLGALLLRRGGHGVQSDPAVNDRRRATIAMLVVYSLFAVLVVTLVDKKQDRYILPIFPAVDILAGVGLVKLGQIAADKCVAVRQWLQARGISSPGLGYSLLAVGVIAVQAAFALPHFPYYLTYFNPLLGGERSAAQWVTVGWGEGLELAGDYLNQKPNADRLKVTAWYMPTFMAYFQGTVTDFFSIGKQEKMTSDYVVFYLNQVQRQMPDPELIAYYQRHYTPEYVAHLHDLDYAWVYAVPIERRTDWQTSQVANKLILYGYRQTAAPGLWTVQLVWENLGTSAQEGLWAALQRFEGPESSPAAAALSWQPCTLAPGFSPADAQKTGALGESVCALRVDNLEPGVYSLHAGFGAASGGVVDLLAPRGDVGVSVASDGTPSLTTYQAALDALTQQMLPLGAHPLHLSYNNAVALIGYKVIPPAPQGEQAVAVTLYWRALQEIAQPAGLAQSFMTRFDLVAPDGSRPAGAADKMLTSAPAGDRWSAGTILADAHQIPIPDGLPAGDYRLSVSLTKATSGEIVPCVDEASGLLSAAPISLETVISVK
jgi:4-amino-4-deoxy-L-arabinose transferase-like glycosyltransferase